MASGRAASIRDILAAPSFRNLLIAAIIGAMAAAGSAALVLNATPVYVSGSTLLIDQPLVIAAPGGEGAIAKLNLLRNKYAGLLGTQLVVLPVAEATGIPPAEIAGSVGAIVPAQSLLFSVTARSGSPARAQEIAAGATTGLVEYLEAEQDDADIPDEQRITLTVVSDAGPGGQVEPTGSRAVTVAAAALVLAMGLAYVLIQLATAPRRAP